MKKLLQRIVAYILCFQIGLSPCFAEIDFRYLPGMSNVVNPGYEHLSPVNGFIALKGVIPGLRFNGNYDNKEYQNGNGFTYPSNITIEGSTDHPYAWTETLVQYLFPSLGGMQLVETNRLRDYFSDKGKLEN